MLTGGIAGACSSGAAALAQHPGVVELGSGTPGDGANAPAPAFYATDLATFSSSEELGAEVSGPVSLVVRYADSAALEDTLAGLEGQLTATLHLDETAEEDLGAARQLLPVLEERAGRVLVGGWPTGVDVGHTMVHGGPFPATSDPRTTSVGTLATDRFLRPVAYQNLPDALLPEPVRDDNPWGLTRLVDGRLEPGAAHTRH